MAKVFIAVNTAWNAINFRAGLIYALCEAGHEVVVIAPYDVYVPRIKILGANYSAVSLDKNGIHPGRDILLALQFYRLLRNQRQSVFLGFTIKPNIYGSLVANSLGIPVINNIAGLGFVFVYDNWLCRFVRCLYRMALSRSCKVFFQNAEDLQLFVSDGLVKSNVAALVPGSGIDLQHFVPVALPSNIYPIRFLLIARLLWQKGIGEFVEAARFLRRRGVVADFFLMGFVDDNNPASVPRAQIDDWMSEGVISYLGTSDDVRLEISRVDCVVLPSYYREGTPRSLLEAAAMARPIVTTDSVGCRDVVDDGINGYLCRPKDAADLAEKMAQIVSLSPEEREEMGLRGRAKVERQFDEKIVVHRYLEAIEAALDVAKATTPK